MFTGIVTEIAKIHNLQENQKEDLLITLEVKNHDNLNRKIEIGSSISCNGVCLTIIKKELVEDSFFFDFQVSDETINKTNLGDWRVGGLVNIEFALKVGDELGGHLVSGHIDSLAKICKIENSKKSRIFTFQAKRELMKFICQKGSVTLNGVSLTVNDVVENEFQVNIIDHTYENTNFKKLNVGDEVNLEIDQVARYLNNFNKYQ